ncbi:MAG: DUF1998 domain-containing protein, partial [Xanthomonadales bacterium]|nr:DUF1998 domain-containing protein [Xanthomonadales bacterium]
YGPVNLPDQELHTTALWWQLPPDHLQRCFANRQQALDGFAGAAQALHTVAALAVMAEPSDLRHVVTDSDGGWFARRDERGRMQVQDADGSPLHGGERFAPTLYLYDNYPGGVGLSEPLFDRQHELIANALVLIAACDCVVGCPACVGPVLAADESCDDDTPKSLALRVLDELSQSSHGAGPRNDSMDVMATPTAETSSQVSPRDMFCDSRTATDDPW